MTSSRLRQSLPNTAFRRLRGDLSPGEFAAAVRRAAREIGEQVSCDARYVGRVESGEIKCPNYAYERVFRHMYPGRSLQDLGFAPREDVRGKRSAARGRAGPSIGPPSGPSAEPSAGPAAGPSAEPSAGASPGPRAGSSAGPGPQQVAVPEAPAAGPFGFDSFDSCDDEESDVLRRAFMTGPAAVAATLSLDPPAAAQGAAAGGPPGRVGASEVSAVETAVRRIRVLDDRLGADTLYERSRRCLRTAYALLDEGSYSTAVGDRLHAGAGELAISVGWLAHDSGQLGDARSYYAEALATARMSNDPALEAHAFSNASFLARDAGRPREAVRAAQAGQQAAKHLSSARLLSLLALREAGGWAGLGDRGTCERALVRAGNLFAKGRSDADPEWMSFFGEAELAGLEAQCWAALRRFDRAAERARLAVALQDPHFTRNIALFTAELAGDLTGRGDVAEAAEQGEKVLRLLDGIRSSRVRRMLDSTARSLGGHRHMPEVAEFLAAHRVSRRAAAQPA